jgi:hypothetical protein
LERPEMVRAKALILLIHLLRILREVDRGMLHAMLSQLACRRADRCYARISMGLHHRYVT